MYKSEKDSPLNTFFIFNLDGTIWNTQCLVHAYAESMALNLKFELLISPQDICDKFAGIPSQTIFKEILEKENVTFSQADIIELTDLKWNLVRKTLADPETLIKDWLIDSIILPLSKAGYQMAVTSVSPSWYIEKIANIPTRSGVRLKQLIQTIISAEQILESKLNESTFSLARNLLNIDPASACYVVTNAYVDIQKAIEEDMKIIFISPNDLPPMSLWESFHVKHARNEKEVALILKDILIPRQVETVIEVK